MSTPLARRTWVAQAARARRCLLVPVGSFEQHGPHLPLSTDSCVAAAICEDAAAQRDVDVAPVFAYGASGEHAGFAGLLSLGTEVTAAALTELVRSARDSWSGVLFVSGHGGNLDALARVSEVASREGDRVSTWVPRDADGDAHAGASETSVMLTIDPDLVGAFRSRAPADLPADWERAVRQNGVRALFPTGVIGDPARASRERGWSLRRAWCAEVVAMIDALETLA